ncbi:RNA-binding protein [Enterococcus faecalis]|nr:DUF3850 domain-containing protein [Enterococcus faecalis]OSM25619.1 RNA-binding protein [Enterococcus faecalis]OSM28818.1 RNA-binding protein [Enterococcus faecalis]WPH48026.1 DUF3850 domain-containing protein [Enterococcus faecalis]
MIVTHKLKIDIKYFKAILSGKKNFEIRNNDRDFKVGDTVVLQEITNDRIYTGREVTGIITYITDFEQKDGFVVFSFELLKNQTNK